MDLDLQQAAEQEAQQAAEQQPDNQPSEKPDEPETLQEAMFGGGGVSTHSRPKAAGASAETLNRQGLHCPVSLRFH